MDENVINDQLKNVRNYLGSYAVDELNEIKISNYPSFVVINLDERRGIGSHWISIAIYQNELFICDPLGGLIPNGANPQELINFLHVFTNSRHLYITKQLQHESSGTCGLYCVTFVQQMSQTNCFFEFLRLFTTDKLQNDMLVKFLNKSVNL